MPVRFNPTGSLDIASDPADLPSQVEGKVEVSGAMQRCVNLHLDRAGIAATRRGSAKLNSTAITTAPTRIIEQAGVRYTLGGGSIYRNETSIASGLDTDPWSGILYNSYLTTTQAVFATNGTDRKRIEGSTAYEWGSESPTVAPTLSLGNLTGLTGDYNVKYTWARKEGATVVWESNPSPAAVLPLTLANQSLVIAFTLPTDTQITHVRIYRTLTSGAIYYWDQDYTIAAADLTAYDYSYIYSWQTGELLYYDDLYQCFYEDLTNHLAYTYSWESDYNDSSLVESIFIKFTHPWENTLYNSNQVETTTADDSLGAECDWIDHDRPPVGGGTVLGPGFGGVCFILKDNNLHYCLPNQPEYWPELYYIEVCSQQFPLKAAAFLSGSLFVANEVEIFNIQGSGPGTFFPLPLSAQTGAVNMDCFVAVQGYGILHLGNDGIYQFSAGKDQLITRGQFEPLFRGETVGSVPGLNRTYIANCWMTVFHGKLYFGYPGGDSVYPDNVLVWDLGTNRSVLHQYAASFKAVGIDYANSRLLAGDTSGYIWQWEVLTLTDDDGSAIDWELQSKDFNQYYKYFPRYAKYDVKVVDGTANGYIVLDDSVKQTHPITGDRLTRKRLVTGCTGDRLAVRLSGSGRAQVYGVEIE